MFFKGEVGDKNIFRGGVPAYSSNRQFTLKRMRNWAFACFLQLFLISLKVAKTDLCKKYF
jgi:hypothetical protein